MIDLTLISRIALVIGVFKMTRKIKPYTTYTKEFKQDGVDEIYRGNNLPNGMVRPTP